MPQPLLTLAFDTSGAHVCTALLRGAHVLAARAETMSRGQAERLMPLLQEVMDGAQAQWADLDRIGVGIGPGNFTGIRISVSCARGLALAAGVPAIGVSTFDAIHNDAPDCLAAVPAPRDHLYVQAQGELPRHILAADAPGPVHLPPAPADLAVAIGQVAAARQPGDAPAPMYIKPADAAPSRDTPPVILP